MNKTVLRWLPRGHGRNALDVILEHYFDARRDCKVGKGSFGEIFRTQNGFMMYVCVCVFIKLHITAQSGPVIYSFYVNVCNPPGGYLS